MGRKASKGIIMRIIGNIETNKHNKPCIIAFRPYTTGMCNLHGANRYNTQRYILAWSLSEVLFRFLLLISS